VRDFRLAVSVHLPGRLRDFRHARRIALAAGSDDHHPQRVPPSPSRPFRRPTSSHGARCLLQSANAFLLDAPPPTYDEGRELFEQIVDFGTPRRNPRRMGERCASIKRGRGRSDQRSASMPSRPSPSASRCGQMGGSPGTCCKARWQKNPCPYPAQPPRVEILDPETTRAAVYANQTRATQNAESPMRSSCPISPRRSATGTPLRTQLDAGTKLVSLYHELALFTAKRTGRLRPKRAPKRSGARAVSNSTTTSTCTGSRCRRACPCNCRCPFHRDLKRLRRVTTKTRRQCGAPGAAPRRVEGHTNPVLLFGGSARSTDDARSLRQKRPRATTTPQ